MSDKLTEAFRLYFHNIVLIGAVILTIYLPLNLASEAASPSIGFDMTEFQRQLEKGDIDPEYFLNNMSNMNRFGVGAGVRILSGLILMLLAPALMGAFIHIIANSRQGLETTYKSAFQTGFQFWWKMMWVQVLAFPIVAIGTLFCIIPGILVGIYFAFIPAMVILEGADNPVDVLSRSTQLTRGYRWELLGALIILGIVSVTLSMAIEISAFFPFGEIFVLKALTSSISSVIGYLPLTVVVLYYMDARIAEAEAETKAGMAME